jgi:hypothetical protein
MGFISWKTQDTKRSIANAYSSRATFSVVMTDDQGNQWQEDEYDGYGEFGGKDFYELLAEMNGKKTRDEGIDIAFGDKPYKSPNLTESTSWQWVDEPPEVCYDQGYFYSDKDDDEW